MPSLFTTETPADPNLSDGAPGLVTGTTMVFLAAGSVTHIRYYAPTTATGTWIGAIYEVDATDDPDGNGAGTLLGQATFSSMTGGAWNTVALSPAVSVNTSNAYRVVVHSSEGRYVLTASFWTANLTNGNIRGIQGGSDPVGIGTLRNGNYITSGSLAYPNHTNNQSNYFIDVVATFGDASISASTVAAVAAVPAPTVTTSNPRKVADRGSTQNETSQSSTAVDMAAAGSIATGNYLVARLALDNAGSSGAAVTLGVTDPRSNSWTTLGPANQDPGAANAGTTCYIAYAKVVNAYTNGDDITFTYNSVNVPAKAIVIEEWANLHATVPVAVAATTATGASTSPSISRTPGAAGQLFYAALSIEGPVGDTYTQDSDTTDGPWQTLTSLATANGTAASNQCVRGAAKLVTGTTAQTWNPTITSRDWGQVAVVFDTAPQQADATVSPSVVAAVASVPASTPKVGQTASPSTVAAVAAVPSATAAGGGQSSPSVVAAVAAVGGPSVTTDQTVSASTASAVAAVPSAQAAGGGGASPAVVAAVAAVGSPALSAGQAASPTAVAAAADVPAVQVQAGSQVSPSVATAIADVPAPAVSTGTNANAAPDTVPAVAAVPAASAAGGAEASPAEVAAVSSVPAVSVATGSTVTAGTVDAVADVPGAQAAGGGGAAPSSVAAVAAVPTATVAAGSTAAPSAVVAVAAVPAVTVQAGAGATPSTVAAIADVPSAGVAVGVTVTAVAVAAAASVPAPSVTAGGSANVAATTVAASTDVPAAAVSVGVTVTPAGLSIVADVPGPAVATSSTVTPAVIAAVAAVPGGSTSTGSTVTVGGPVAVVALLPAPTVTAENAIAPAVISTTVTLPSPSLHTGSTISPGVVVAYVSVPTPSVSTGGVVVPVPVLTGSASVSSRGGIAAVRSRGGAASTSTRGGTAAVI